MNFLSITYSGSGSQEIPSCTLEQRAQRHLINARYWTLVSSQMNPIHESYHNAPVSNLNSYPPSRQSPIIPSPLSFPNTRLYLLLISPTPPISHFLVKTVLSR